MRFIVDEEAKQVLESFCDLALKSGGLQNREIVDKVFKNTEKIPETTE